MAAKPSTPERAVVSSQDTTLHDPNLKPYPDLAVGSSIAEAIGTQIGRYKLIAQIGEGGMGTVFMAEQQEPVRRLVALKLIRVGMDTAQVVARFEAERQALALMNHLNIAKVLDAGTTAAGLPYFVMELIQGGVPITKYCDDNRLTPRQRLELFVPVCQAIQHAHQKGIIHRDIKPQNILVTACDGKPVPKVIDFGVAKATEQPLTDSTMYTQFGAVVGSLEYMSPEQAEASALGIDTRSDVYSLGVVLYELLTGTTPLGRNKVWKAGFAELIRQIKDVEPPKPSTQISNSATQPAVAAARQMEPARLARLVKGELDWVVMKCLEKDRTRRYESASTLAHDVERYLADEPVAACPPSASYRVRRFIRKHKKGMAAAVAFVLLLIAGLVASTMEAMRANRAEQREHETAQEMQVERDRARLALTQQVAERLDGDLRRLAMAGQVLAATLAQRTDWKEADLEHWMRTVIGQDERIFGMSLAFEPRQFDADREDFCIYLFRGPKEIEKKYLLPPSYMPLYREWDWYKKPIAEKRALWSEPYVDTGGGEIPMVTYTTPIRRGEQIVGVLTLDLSVQYFDVLRGWLEDVNLGSNSYGFVISPTGVIISHPHREYDLAQLVAANQKPRKIAELAESNPSFAALVEQMQTEESGRATAIDPATGKRATFLFAKVPSAGWTFVAVMDEAAGGP